MADDVLGDFSPRSDAGGSSLVSGISNGDLFGGVSSLFSAGTSLLSGQATAQADQNQAQAFDIAAKYAEMNSYLAGESGGLKELVSARAAQAFEGKQEAVAAGNGLRLSGSAQALLRNTAQTSALEQGVLGLQTAINVTNYLGQAEASKAQASASRDAASSASAGGILGSIGGIIGGVAKLGGLFGI